MQQHIPNEEVKSGTRIDDFTIAYLIGHGMNADVFAVWHHTLRTPLVCKRLRPQDADDRKWRRLLRAEGVALAHLNHPGIVRLIAQNQKAHLPYLLLEHVGSSTLRDALLDRGRFAIDEAVRIVQHTGAAVAYAHAQGFLHRDLKPSNIVLRDHGRPVLLDFGVAWRWRTKRQPSDFSGTPQYLAPEQIRRERLTSVTDVYGLGILLFELLTGKRPFRAGADRHDRALSLAARYPQLAEAPFTLRESGCAQAPRKLEQIIARCLARDAHDRFSSVEELLLALDRFTPLKVWPRNVARRCKDFSPFV